MRGPIFFRRRRGYVAVGPLPGLGGWLPAIAAGAASGFLLYFADITFHDAVFHPLHSLRALAYGLGEVMLELVHMLPFVVVGVILAVLIRLLWRRRFRNDGQAEDNQVSRA